MNSYIRYLEKMSALRKGDTENNEQAGESSESTRQTARIAVYRMMFELLMPLILTFVGILILVYDIFRVSSGRIKELSGNEAIIPIVFILAGIFLFMNRYLGNGKGFSVSSNAGSNTSQHLYEMQYQVEFTKKEFEKKFDALFKLLNKKQQEPIEGIVEWQKEELNKLLSGAIEKNLVPAFFEGLQKSLVSQIAEDKKEQLFTIAKRNENSANRLINEVDLLTKRANINLVIGSTVTIAALLVLGYFVMKENFNSLDVKVVAIHFLPRLSLVIFIEFFSFFFLRLYGASLHEIKYYQNELTNIEARGASIILAANYGSEADISNIIKDLVATERNFKLQKGESTVELERNRLETHDIKEILKVALGAVQKKKE